jgi:hypothetical protein
MMIVGAERRAKARPREAEVEQIKRLIEIQSQIVELAKQNDLTAKRCELLRHDVAHGTRPPSWRKRWSALFRRLLRCARFSRDQRCSGSFKLN